ncbi:MAG TPA: Flp family type IVb pilin [Actinomycetota bacterium]|nr:Flp family type IVb pilin [Actinomycetota bacterium]
MLPTLARLRRDDGAVATEYGLILFLVAMAIIAAIAAFGLVLVDMLGTGAGEVESVTGG